LEMGPSRGAWAWSVVNPWAADLPDSLNSFSRAYQTDNLEMAAAARMDCAAAAELVPCWPVCRDFVNGSEFSKPSGCGTTSSATQRVVVSQVALPADRQIPFPPTIAHIAREMKTLAPSPYVFTLLRPPRAGLEEKVL